MDKSCTRRYSAGKKREIFIVRTINHWNNLPKILLEIFKIQLDKLLNNLHLSWKVGTDALWGSFRSGIFYYFYGMKEPAEASHLSHSRSGSEAMLHLPELPRLTAVSNWCCCCLSWQSSLWSLAKELWDLTGLPEWIKRSCTGKLIFFYHTNDMFKKICIDFLLSGTCRQKRL